MHDHFLKLKSNLELDPTFDESISTRHNSVREYLKNNNSSVRDSKLIGSLQRKTRINPGSDGDFDVDILVILGEFHNWVSDGGITPEMAMEQVHSTVKGSNRYSGKSPTLDHPTVSLTYDDNIKVELVPAYIDHIGRDQAGNELGPKGRGYWVVKDGRWEMADYDHEAEYISKRNSLSGGYLIPAIKMLKAIKREHFSDLGSFPLEIIAANIIPISVLARKAANQPIVYSELLQEFFEKAPAHLAIPLKVPDSKAKPIILDSASIQATADMFKRISAHIKSTHAEPGHGKKVENWRTLFGDCFPATV